VAARAAFNLQPIFDDGMAPNRGSPATSCYAPFQLQRKREAHPSRNTIQALDQPNNLRRHAVTFALAFKVTCWSRRHIIQLSTQRAATLVATQRSFAVTTGDKPRTFFKRNSLPPEASTFVSRGFQPS
jgi:hypothetical protein